MLYKLRNEPGNSISMQQDCMCAQRTQIRLCMGCLPEDVFDPWLLTECHVKALIGVLAGAHANLVGNAVSRLSAAMQYLNFLCYVNDILQTFMVVGVCSVGDALLPANTCSSLIVFSYISSPYRKKKKKKKKKLHKCLYYFNGTDRNFLLGRRLWN